MFTGIIEETGKIVRIESGIKSSRISVKANLVFDDLKLGDSVAVNGVCLTVSNIESKIFTADVMSETISRSSLTMLNSGSMVNLERAMTANSRFGGHIVSGHIDGTGKIAFLRTDENAVWITITTSEKIARYIVEKGSVAIDGISLTVAKQIKGEFVVSVIPHTKNETTLLYKKIGDIVNIENDVIGKYIERFTSCTLEKKEIKSLCQNKSRITEDFILKSGF